ncbi:hypothetical protein [Streptomyces fructofermentans]|uniref:hypothetical protein n=1 Tax=Streptomyces fructofermentans TaxID=152141 RepID=UPI0037A3A31E
MGFDHGPDTGFADDDAGGPAGPTSEEHAAWADVRRRATGMTHHEAKAAREEARAAARSRSLTGPDAVRARAEAEEWERVTESMADHAGPYDPRCDPFVQGEEAARADHGGRSSRNR